VEESRQEEEVMARGKRSHPTSSLGIKAPKTMSEINTVHAFGAQGQETSGWPKKGYARIGTLIPGTAMIYRPPRISQDELGGKRRKRKHPTQSIGV
jgi:hypothetical protein